MKFDFFLLNEFEGYTSVLINRPKHYNAFNLEAIYELEEVLLYLSKSTVPLIVFDTHPNGFFCSGGDLKEFSSLKTELQGFEMVSKMAANLNAIESLSSITTSTLSGSVYGGGCEFALSTDLFYASNEAKLGFTQAKFGLSPGWNGMGRLIHKVGYSKSLHLLISKSVLTGEEALALGVIDSLFKTRIDMMNAIEQIAAMPKSVLLGIKDAATLYKQSLSEEAKKKELIQFAQLWGADLHHELVAEFFKNKPTNL